jgi:hypothetical protein
MELHTLLETIEKSGYFDATLEEQVEINKRINGDFDRFREGAFGQGLPALILRDGMPCRVARVISADPKRENALIYEETDLIKNLDDRHRTHWMFPGPKDARLYLMYIGFAIEVGGGVTEVEAYSLLTEIHRSNEYEWNLAPSWLSAPFGKEAIATFYSEQIHQAKNESEDQDDE